MVHAFTDGFKDQIGRSAIPSDLAGGRFDSSNFQIGWHILFLIRHLNPAFAKCFLDFAFELRRAATSQ